MTALLGTLAPAPWLQFMDADGHPVSGGLLYTRAAGLDDVAVATYQDADLTVPHTNPIVLDAAGRATIYCRPVAIRFRLHDAQDAHIRTTDPVLPPAPFNVDLDVRGIAGQSLTSGACVYLADGTEAGGTVAGRWYYTDGDAAETSSDAAMVGITAEPIAQGGVGTIRLQGKLEGLTGLTSGALHYCSTTLGELTATPPATARIVGVADSPTSIVLYAAQSRNVLTAGLGAVTINSDGIAIATTTAESLERSFHFAFPTAGSGAIYAYENDTIKGVSLLVSQQAAGRQALSRIGAAYVVGGEGFYSRAYCTGDNTEGEARLFAGAYSGGVLGPALAEVSVKATTSTITLAGTTVVGGGVGPDSDNARTLGSDTKRFANINLALAPNSAPTRVVVNKGGVGEDATSALGYIAGLTQDVAIAGVGTLRFKGGVLTEIL